MQRDMQRIRPRTWEMAHARFGLLGAGIRADGDNATCIGLYACMLLKLVVYVILYSAWNTINIAGSIWD